MAGLHPSPAGGPASADASRTLSDETMAGFARWQAMLATSNLVRCLKMRIRHLYGSVDRRCTAENSDTNGDESNKRLRLGPLGLGQSVCLERRQRHRRHQGQEGF